MSASTLYQPYGTGKGYSIGLIVVGPEGNLEDLCVGLVGLIGGETVIGGLGGRIVEGMLEFGILEGLGGRTVVEMPEFGILEGLTVVWTVTVGIIEGWGNVNEGGKLFIVLLPSCVPGGGCGEFCGMLLWGGWLLGILLGARLPGGVKLGFPVGPLWLKRGKLPGGKLGFPVETLWPKGGRFPGGKFPGGKLGFTCGGKALGGLEGELTVGEILLGNRLLGFEGGWEI